MPLQAVRSPEQWHAGDEMDGSPLESKEAVLMPQPQSLTFAWLYARVQELAAETAQSRPSRIERWSFWIGACMGGLGLLIAAAKVWIPLPVVLGLLMACLVLEIGALGVALVLMLSREVPALLRARERHAGGMDTDFAAWKQLAERLRDFPKDQREARLRFVLTLRQNMGDRMGMLFGGIQRLGVLPLLIALYLQFHNWTWGDWAGAFDVNLVAGLLIWFMVLLYAGGWLLVGLRTRLDSYVSLLEESLAD